MKKLLWLVAILFVISVISYAVIQSHWYRLHRISSVVDGPMGTKIQVQDAWTCEAPGAASAYRVRCAWNAPPPVENYSFHVIARPYPKAGRPIYTNYAPSSKITETPCYFLVESTALPPDTRQVTIEFRFNPRKGFKGEPLVSTVTIPYFDNRVSNYTAFPYE